MLVLVKDMRVEGRRVTRLEIDHSELPLWCQFGRSEHLTLGPFNRIIDGGKGPIKSSEIGKHDGRGTERKEKMIITNNERNKK